METCYRHPNRETGVSCSNCGRPICPDCMTPTSVGMRCPECSKERTKVRTAGSIAGDPVVAYALIAINVVIWFVEIATSGGGHIGGGRVIADGALYGPLIAAPQHEYWRLVTSGFLHDNQLPNGIFHIGFNMYLLYILGRMLEPAIGRLRFAVLYLTSLLGGSFGALLLSSHSFTVGASGAVFGLMGGAVVMLRSRGFDPMASGIPGLILLNLVFSLAFPGISIGGHIGGLITGAAAAYLLVELGERRRLQVPALLGCLVLAVAAVVGSLAVVAGSGLSG